jgi:hypothetical protein
MQQIDPNFDERNAGFNRFSKFVIEAGQKGVILLNKLDNGQYEVAPGPAAKAPVPESAPRGRPAIEPGREGRESRGEDGGRRGRGRRGRGGRDRAGRDAAARERANGNARPDVAHRPSVRDERADSGLTLARAFQLMAQALSEFRSPVGQEALRLRMVAMHGREDPLLDPGRFPRLLRQANDAEVADVRKVGDDDYEIAAQRGSSRPAMPPSPPPAEEPSSAATTGAAAAENTGGTGRDNGQRLGVRFRRGSRAPMRTGEIPLIGVVKIEQPPAAAADQTEQPLELPPPEISEVPKRARPRRAPRKRVTSEAATSEAPEAAATPAESPPARRPRTRSRKKPE